MGRAGRVDPAHLGVAAADLERHRELPFRQHARRARQSGERTGPAGAQGLGGVEPGDRAAERAVRAIVCHQPVAEHLVGGGLQRRVQTGANFEAAFGRGFGAEAVDQLAPDLLAEPVGPGHDVRPVERAGDHGAGLGRRRLLGRDRLVVHHAVQHPVPPGARRFGKAKRVVVVRPLGQRGEEGRLRQGDLVQRLVEIRLCRSRHAVRLQAEVDLVQIQLENSLLGQRLLDADGEHSLLHLARQRPLVGPEQHVARDLLRDGGGADRAAAAAHLHHVGDRGAGHGAGVDTLVGPEILVLGGNEGLLDDVRNGGVRHEDAPLLGQFGDQPVIAGVDPAHHRRLVLAQPVHRRQFGGELLEGMVADCAAHDADHHQPRQRDAGQPADRAQRGPARARHGFGPPPRFRRWLSRQQAATGSQVVHRQCTLSQTRASPCDAEPRPVEESVHRALHRRGNDDAVLRTT